MSNSMKVGDEVIVLDDGRVRRPVYGIVRAVAEDFLVIEHILWGYGILSVQSPLPHIYRKERSSRGGKDVWASTHCQCMDKENGLVEFNGYTEHSILCEEPTQEMFDTAFGGKFVK